MTAVPVEPVRHGWEEMYNRAFDIMEDSVRNRDYSLVKAMHAQFQLSDVDWTATFYKEAQTLGPAAFDNSNAIKKQLEERTLQSNDKTKVNCNKIEASFKKTAESDKADDGEEWENQFNKDMDELDEKTMKDLKDLRDWGIKKIKELPKNLQKGTADMLVKGRSAVQVFLGNAVQWLKGAMDSIWKWLKNAWDQIKRWANDVKNWFADAWTKITGLFGASSLEIANAGLLSGSPQNGSDRTKGLEAIPGLDNIASKLQDLGLDSFNLVKRGNGWLMELPL